MAFRLQVKLPEVEYRGTRSGLSTKTGKRWMSLVLEDLDSNQIECSVPEDMQSDVLGLHLTRGDMCAVTLLAVARADGNSYIQLTALPTVLDEEVDF